MQEKQENTSNEQSQSVEISLLLNHHLHALFTSDFSSFLSAACRRSLKFLAENSIKHTASI